ncbi:DUF3888 domain-containing protein [Clostridium sp. JN-9]|nr:DUF3888 domain-containing protein [Clostridium sp. JN-9]
MKKVLFILCLCIIIIIKAPYITYAHEITDNIKLMQDTNFTAPTNSKEELYQDVFFSMLTPYIEEAVNSYYGRNLSVYTPEEVFNVERPNGGRTFYFVIKVRVMPFEGPHNFVGVDDITLSVSGKDIKVEKYEHIRSN